MPHLGRHHDRRGSAQGTGKLEKNGSCRAISTARLERIAAIPPAAYQRGRLPRPSGIAAWNVHLGAGFALRCFQRLSVPDIATRRCTWRHNRYTSGPSISVLSYWRSPSSTFPRPPQIGTELSYDVLNPARVPL